MATTLNCRCPCCHSCARWSERMGTRSPTFQPGLLRQDATDKQSLTILPNQLLAFRRELELPVDSQDGIRLRGEQRNLRCLGSWAMRIPAPNQLVRGRGSSRPGHRLDLFVVRQRQRLG